jgi:hypothetical protein
MYKAWFTLGIYVPKEGHIVFMISFHFGINATLQGYETLICSSEISHLYGKTFFMAM